MYISGKDEVMDIDALQRTRFCLSLPSLRSTLHFFLSFSSLVQGNQDDVLNEDSSA